jgi:acyl carrier protein
VSEATRPSTPADRALSVEGAVTAVRALLESKGRDSAHVSASTALADLKLSSVDVVELLLIIEEQCGREVDPDFDRNLDTVADLTRLQMF